MLRSSIAPTLLLCFFALVMFTQVGCQTARYVRKDGAYGEVAIPNNSNSWPHYNRDQATKLMAEHFPEGYEVDVEEESVIGQKTDYSENGTVRGHADSHWPRRRNRRRHRQQDRHRNDYE